MQNLKCFETLGYSLLLTNQFLIFFCQVLNWEFWAYLQQVTQPVSGVKCPLTAAATSALVTVGTAVVQHVTAVLSMFRKPASWTSRPVHSVDDFRVSNWCSNTEQKPSASPWLLEWCTWWATPRSSHTPPGFRSNFRVVLDRSFVVYLVWIFRFIFHFLNESEVFSWSSLIRSPFGWHLSDHQQDQTTSRDWKCFNRNSVP